MVLTCSHSPPTSASGCSFRRTARRIAKFVNTATVTFSSSALLAKSPVFSAHQMQQRGSPTHGAAPASPHIVELALIREHSRVKCGCGLGHVSGDGHRPCAQLMGSIQRTLAAIIPRRGTAALAALRTIYHAHLQTMRPARETLRRHQALNGRRGLRAAARHRGHKRMRRTTMIATCPRRMSARAAGK